MDTVVKVEKAKTGDEYGTVHYDLEAAKKAYLETLQYATKKRYEGGGSGGGH
jgi:hypothetical protein